MKTQQKELAYFTRHIFTLGKKGTPETRDISKDKKTHTQPEALFKV